MTKLSDFGAFQMLDRLNSEDETKDAKRIEQLETELERVGKAFEDYIATTEGLEVDVKKELGEMQTKLKYSTKANEELVRKLKSMESLFQNLEKSSEDIRKKLKIETNLRRQAEKSLTEAELELKSKSVRIRQLERNDHSALRIADSGVITETVNNTSKAFTDRDLEAVTDELISTQEKLMKTEEQLLRSQILVQDLERNIQNIDNEGLASLSGDDKELLRELDEIRAEIGGEEIKAGSVGSKQSNGKAAVNYEYKLMESREENTRLMEEIACLRNILYEKGDAKVNASKGNGKKLTVIREEDQIEIQKLRKQIEETVDENIALQEKLQKYDIIGFSPEARSEEMAIGEKLRETEEKLARSQEECSEMRNEVLALSESLYYANQRRGQGSVDFSALKRQDNELLSARNELVDKKREISTLESDLISSKEQVRKLTKEISSITGDFEKVKKEHESVVEELQQTESALAAANDSKATQENEMQRLQLAVEKAPEKDAELQTLRSQFKKLSEKNETLSQQVRDVMHEVVVVREKQDKASQDSQARMTVAKEMQNDIADAVTETRQRNNEVEELALMMEKRMGSTELSIEALDSEIAVAMKTLHGAKLTVLDKKDPLGLVLPSESDLESDEGEKKESDEGEKEEIQAEEVDGAEEKEVHTDTVETKAKDTPSAFDSIESVLERTRRLLEVSATVEKLTIVSKSSKSLHEGRTNDDDQASVSTVSLSGRKASKYEEIVKRVADYEAMYSNENRELEAHADEGLEIRE